MNNEQLKGLSEAICAKLAGKPWEWRCRNGSNWNAGTESNDFRAMIENEYDFRAKPEPVCRPWSKPEHVPGPVCWLRSKNGYLGVGMIQWVDSQGVVAIQCGDGTTGKFIDYEDTAKMEYSTDRREWHPCTVEEPC